MENLVDIVMKIFNESVNGRRILQLLIKSVKSAMHNNALGYNNQKGLDIK